MNTLPDYLDHNLKIILIGLNPSPISVEAGYYYANPRNRFWAALNSSRLVNEPLQPGVAAMQELFRKYRIGFTDLVKRPTSMGHELRAADFRQRAPVLRELLLQYQPGIVWFQGAGVYKNYLKYAEGVEAKICWGLQKHCIGKSHVFVTPNPSPANASYSIEDLAGYYNALVSFQVRELFGMGI